ncbi:hypothetical protein FACS1894137_06610 [Spirochaetia bacterium]|nr:hypothetical protein FACS1894137_06610 [Spirochaetia bacterium]
MLDDVTKRRIDAARDILVGKVPVPSSQVEQITIALIYKFMDDMDKESVSMGGKSSFFSGAYKKYAWSNIFDPRLGGFELINLYGEAIAKLNQNPNIPQLFRDIFKNAYLPYRDPETLKLFLKTINEFSYDHSEDLGDAFEYLLSVLDSQGDAGQFRTPRHIIDFMVAVLDPKKQETIIDPACGTAGFLISSYKHIRKANTGTTKTVQRPGDLLSPTERKKLLTNFKGYDISPDMVRLSLVNLYLHGFVQPQIYEYDTLTSEDRWNEYADVILANPPFMSPKGGIIPHKRFSVQSKRSEVLFVDYIAEHLTPTGRAAVIVPEGIIFQSGGAYKQLRKMLLEKYLYGVVSLPAGVFNPYSGVKTSILLLDRQIASKSDAILFVKIENDGLALGAQRREIDKNDLPDALKVIREYLKALRTGRPGSFKVEGKPCGTLVVKKEKLAESGEYSLIGDRYQIIERRGKRKWPMVKIGDICELGRGRVINKLDIERNPGSYPVYSSQTTNDGIFGYIDTYDFEGEYVTWTTDGANAGTVFYRNGKFNCTNVCGTLKLNDSIDYVSMKYLSLVLNLIAYKYVIKVGNPKLMNKEMSRITIPLPPIEVQKEIVGEIDGYQKVIDGARQVVDNWNPQIEVDPEWPMVKLGDVCENYDNKRRPVEKSERKSGKYPYYGASGIVDYVDSYIFDGEFLLISEDGANLLMRNTPIAFSISGKNWVNNHAHILKFADRETQKWVEFYINQINIELYITGMAQPKLNQSALNKIEIPFPPIEIQQEIVAKIEAEQKVVDGCRELMIGYEGKIKRVVDGVWGE